MNTSTLEQKSSKIYFRSRFTILLSCSDEFADERDIAERDGGGGGRLLGLDIPPVLGGGGGGGGSPTRK